MSRRPYIPTQWDCNEKWYLAGWKDAEFGLELGAGAPPRTGGKYDHATFAYESGYRDFWRKNPQAGGGV